MTGSTRSRGCRRGAPAPRCRPRAGARRSARRCRRPAPAASGAVELDARGCRSPCPTPRARTCSTVWTSAPPHRGRCGAAALGRCRRSRGRTGIRGVPGRSVRTKRETVSAARAGRSAAANPGVQTDRRANDDGPRECPLSAARSCRPLPPRPPLEVLDARSRRRARRVAPPAAAAGRRSRARPAGAAGPDSRTLSCPPEPTW